MLYDGANTTQPQNCRGVKPYTNTPTQQRSATLKLHTITLNQTTTTNHITLKGERPVGLTQGPLPPTTNVLPLGQIPYVG